MSNHGELRATVGDDDSIAIEVAYALPERQLIVPLRVPRGSTIREAIEQSGIRDRFEGVVVEDKGVGVFSKRLPLDHVLEEGDRVEIYRPLLVDPKQVRRELARKKAEAKPHSAGDVEKSGPEADREQD